MFNRKPTPELTALNEVITDALSVLNDHIAGSPEYGQALKHLTKLYALKESTPPSRVTPDTIALVLGNLAGIILIVGHERGAVVTSKALSFVMKAAR